MGDYQGNPLSCATACKTLEIMKRDNIPGQVAEKGKYFLEELQDLARRHPLIGQVDGIGLYLSIEFIEDQIDQAVEIFDRVIGRAENKFRIK